MWNAEFLLDIIKNAARGLAPPAVLRRWRLRTGGTAPPAQKVDYGFSVFETHARHLPEGRVKGLSVLEIGPGDNIVTALLFLVRGAQRVVLLDADDLPPGGPAGVLNELKSRLDAEERRALGRLVRRRGGGIAFDESRLCLLPRRRADGDGLGLAEEFDMIYSHAVLEHVRDLDACFRNMAAALKRGGMMSHVVDLRDHRFGDAHPLRFLCYPGWVWESASSNRACFTNRRRLRDYEETLRRAGLELRNLVVTRRCGADYLESLRPSLHADFVGMSDDDLCPLVFHLVADKP